MEKIPEIDFTALLSKLPPRVPEAHKGDFGHVAVIGGDYGYPGAPVLSALGALRVGAGLVTICSRSSTIEGLNAKYPDIMVLDIDRPKEVKKILKSATVVVLGPGLGLSQWSIDVYNTIIKNNLPTILDADGLKIYADNILHREQLILTPHPGEASILLKQDKPVSEIQRLEYIKKLIELTNAIVVLKGHGTLVGGSESPIKICTHGNPGMAVGGMGDLLSGIIAGLVGQGIDMYEATQLAVCIHAQAGDIAAENGQRGLVASDLLPIIQKLIG